MNLTVQKETKRVRRKGKGGKQQSKTVVKETTAKTFFTFFDQLASLETAESQSQYEELESNISMDFEIFLLLMNQIVPDAILYYTGEAEDDDFDPQDAMFGESDEDDEDEDDDDDDDDKNDDDDDFRNPFAPSDGVPMPTFSAGGGPPQAQEDCKTQ